MAELKKDSLMITHDEEIGVVYYPAKGAVSTTTPHHAQIIERVWQDYLEDKLSAEDRRAFEGYVERSFTDKPDLPMIKYTNLLETHALGRLEIMVANKCNLNCRYCYAHGGDYDCESQILTPNSAKKYLRALFADRYTAVDVVMLFGGEPTIAPDTIRTICEFFEQYSSLGIIEKMPIFTMVTNGTLIDESLARTIKKYNIQVTVSVDGPPEINDQLRVDKTGNGTFAKIERGIKLLQEAGNPPRMIESTYTTLHKEMGYSKEDIHQYLQEHFQIERILTANCEPNGYDDSLACSVEDIQYNDINDVSIQQSILYLRRKLSQKRFLDLPCGAGYSSIVLLPNGEIYPCHHFTGNSEYLLSRFNGSTFDFGYYPKASSMLSNAQKLKNPQCKDCWAKVLCSACTACMLLSEKINGTDTYDCHWEREHQRKMLLALAKKLPKKEDN